MNQFDPDEALSIKESQEILQKESLQAELAFIECHLSFLPASIDSLQESGLPLTQSLAIVNEVETKINSIPGDVGLNLPEKLNFILSKHPGWKTLQEVSQVQNGEANFLPAIMSPADVTS